MYTVKKNQYKNKIKNNKSVKHSTVTAVQCSMHQYFGSGGSGIVWLPRFESRESKILTKIKGKFYCIFLKEDFWSFDKRKCKIQYYFLTNFYLWGTTLVEGELFVRNNLNFPFKVIFGFLWKNSRFTILVCMSWM